jgi:hypothetical protein
VFAQWKFECRVFKLSVPRALGGTHRLKPDPLIPRHHGSKQNRQIANGRKTSGLQFPDPDRSQWLRHRGERAGQQGPFPIDDARQRLIDEIDRIRARKEQEGE